MGKKMRAAYLRLYACSLLAMLLSAYTGQAVHIFREDPMHFAGFTGTMVPDNGTSTQVVERCILCNYFFFPYLEETQAGHWFYSAVLAILHPEATQSCCFETRPVLSLRAPPVV